MHRNFKKICIPLISLTFMLFGGCYPTSNSQVSQTPIVMGNTLMLTSGGLGKDGLTITKIALNFDAKNITYEVIKGENKDIKKETFTLTAEEEKIIIPLYEKIIVSNLDLPDKYPLPPDFIFSLILSKNGIKKEIHSYAAYKKPDIQELIKILFQIIKEKQVNSD